MRLSNDLSYRSQCRSCQLCNISINIPLLRATNKARQTNSKNLPGIQRRAARSGDAVCASNFPHRKTTGQRCLSPDIDFNAAIHVLIIHGKLQWLRDEIVTVHLIQRDRQRIHLLPGVRWAMVPERRYFPDTRERRRPVDLMRTVGHPAQVLDYD